MSEPIIRLMQKDDQAKVEAFFAQMGNDARMFFNRHHGNEKWALKFFSDHDDEHILRWIAVDGDEMVGYVFLWDTDSMIPWFGIAVAESVRGTHFSHKLVDTAKAWCVEHGKGGILLTTHVANIRAQILYENCGFEKYGVHNSGELLYLLRF